MLKRAIRANLESIVDFTIQGYGGTETLAFDLSKQCVSSEDVDKCLGAMLEHVSYEELEAIVKILETDVFRRYTQALSSGVRTIDSKIITTLKLLGETEGSC